MKYVPSIKLPSFLGGKKALDITKDPFMHAKEFTDSDKEIWQQLSSKYQCDCEVDPQYDFSCKHGVIWFCMMNRDI